MHDRIGVVAVLLVAAGVTAAVTAFDGVTTGLTANPGVPAAPLPGSAVQPGSPTPPPERSATYAVLLTPTITPTPSATMTPGPSPTFTRQPSPTPTIEPGGCRAYGSKTASEAAHLGDTIGITLTIRATCVGRRSWLHTVLALDGSDAMQGQPRLQMQKVAAGLVRDLDLTDYPTTRLGVVEFNTQARRLCGLTNDEARLLNCIRRVDAEGDASIEAGLLEALRVIKGARRDIGTGEYATEIVLLFSNGHNADGCDEAVRASRRVRGDGVLMIAICVGRDCDERCMRELASSPRYYFRAENAGTLEGVFQQIRDRILNVNLKRVTVTDKLPPDMRYVEGSANPVPTTMSPEHDLLTWSDVYIPRDGVTYTFRAEPLELGHHATNLEAHADLEANTGWKGTLVYPVPTVWVKPPPTPTIRYIVDRTPSPTPSATPMLLPPATPTQNTAAGPVHLPIGYRSSRSGHAIARRLSVGGTR